MALAAERGRVSSLKDKAAEDRLAEWESVEGEDKPTWSQLKALAHAYHRPVVTFFLKAPPKKAEGLHDFRTIGDHDAGDSSELDALLRQVKARQREVRELLEAEGAGPLEYLGQFSANHSVDEVVRDIRRVVGLGLDQQRQLGGRDRLFKVLRDQIEGVGIFVLLLGDLGSHHTRMEPTLFRGIALPDDIAPFIVVNSYDAKAAQLFTLVHELAHLWIGAGGISNYSPLEGPQLDEHQRVEQFCNQVAEEMLIPREQFHEVWQELVKEEPEVAARRIADEFGVSEAAAAYRLWRFNKIDNETWWGLYRMYKARWEHHRKKQKEAEGGPSRYVVVRHHLGRKFIDTVLNALDEGELSHIRAARILGVRTPGFKVLREKAG